MSGDKSVLPGINRWERNRALPHPETRAKLCEVFGKPIELWGVEEQKSSIWNIPYLRNPYFTGREQVLNDLYMGLSAERTVARIRYRALSGLGGIGKTQTAIEYAYRYANVYKAVLWVGADSRHTLNSDFAKLALTLNLREKEEIDQSRLLTAVKNWLQEHRPWLLIFDNADNLAMVVDFLPRLPGGAILLTTRSQDTGPYITPIEIEKMSRDEGVRFLLRRITARGDKDEEEDLSKSVPDMELDAAQELWELMDGLCRWHWIRQEHISRQGSPASPIIWTSIAIILRTSFENVEDQSQSIQMQWQRPGPSRFSK
jgi:transcriptional regulator with XRE-family HTH domain